MNKAPAEEPESEPGSGGRFHTVVQPHRDLETNWAVDLAKNLEEYLLKICSGEIGSSSQGGHDVPQLSVNFAEAALLLQGSVQVYSRKVEYLYSLVLHTLEFISRKSSQEQATGASTSSQEGSVLQTHDEENDKFWGLDDIPAEAKNSLDGANAKDAQVNYLMRPPANLVVLEGDCLDAIGDAGELESYLLATNDLFRDFVLLDSCDAVAVNEFLNSQNKSGKLNSDARLGISSNSKSHKSFLSPNGRSGGTGHKLSAQKSLHTDINQSPLVDGFESNDCGVENSPPADDFPDQDVGDFDVHNGFSDDSDGEDPWKPLNPHEPGNLKVKPYKKGQWIF
ncbi:OLC1v1020513C1 [Oldenlandia corymbosa var. corymbosa]|uniref:OLC1v1020513C1 n=1 Tax=Oldenlandia corymbosa var. corymbosa TaxID=529605 RepID=A0AAV1EGR0_OLDCO|nr:OLC1v1020513C1 [Oldenlandia corymbosa var. corymbosa]